MKLLIIFGDAAVGKMTVGQELAKITGFRLFHNHMTIEPVIEIFGYFHSKVINRLRDAIFEEFAESNNYGLIFTFMWALDSQSDWDYVERLSVIFKKNNAEVYYAELHAPQDIRLRRNITENRLVYKPSKRNIEASGKRLINDDENYRFVSYDGEIPFKNYIKIDNSELSAEETALLIKNRFLFE